MDTPTFQVLFYAPNFDASSEHKWIKDPNCTTKLIYNDPCEASEAAFLEAKRYTKEHYDIYYGFVGRRFWYDVGLIEDPNIRLARVAVKHSEDAEEAGPDFYSMERVRVAKMISGFPRRTESMPTEQTGPDGEKSYKHI